MGRIVKRLLNLERYLYKISKLRNKRLLSEIKG